MCLPTKHTSPSEVKNIISKLRNNKSPGHDLITNTITKKLPKKAILLLTYIYNGILRLSYIPSTWKYSVIILIHKPGKPPNIPSSYRPISLLPTFSKILEKIIIKRIYSILNGKNIIPNAQFGFRSNHSSLHQIHRIVDNIASSLEQKNFCSGVFLDVAQAFDRIWHEGLLYKLLFLPTPLYLTLKSFLTNRSFVVRCEEEYSNIHTIRAGVPQGSILAPTLFNIYTADLPQSNNTNLATFADDTVITSSSHNLDSAINNLQDHLTNLQNWFNLWRMKINESKSTHITFTFSPKNIPPVYLNDKIIPMGTSVKYLGLHLDKRLTWATHIKLKRKSLNLRLHKVRQLLRSKISLENKMLIYKQLIRPAMTYGIQLWGSTKMSNLKIFQSFQSINLRLLTNAPWYVSNRSLHHDLNVPTISALALYNYNNFHKNVLNHPNPLVAKLAFKTLPDNPPRRLKRKWPRDLLTK
uniref:Putative RNA-directed DNA polymerase n=1 Tax=Schizaphis graminum TaxID=13262 RepID=A0A2S2PH29_SCHGA